VNSSVSPATFSETASDLWLDDGHVPNEAKHQHFLDKSLLPVQRLKISGDQARTVAPREVAATRRQEPSITVRTEWTVVVDSPRRARLLAAIFGDDSRGA
jgi:hypothetical protein